MRYTTGLPNVPPGHVQKCAIMLDLCPRGSPKLTCILIVFYIFILSMSVTIRYIVFQDIAGSKDHKLKQRKSYLCPLCSYNPSNRFIVIRPIHAGKYHLLYS